MSDVILNYIDVSGTEHEAIAEALIEQGFEYIVPKPPALNDHLYDDQVWHKWCMTNWGTKWDMYDNPRDGFGRGSVFLEDKTRIKFFTANSSPWRIMEKLRLVFPKNTFKLVYKNMDEANASFREVL